MAITIRQFVDLGATEYQYTIVGITKDAEGRFAFEGWTSGSNSRTFADGYTIEIPPKPEGQEPVVLVCSRFGVIQLYLLEDGTWATRLSNCREYSSDEVLPDGEYQLSVIDNDCTMLKFTPLDS